MADTEKIIRKKYDVPIWHKSNLTIDEAVEYITSFTADYNRNAEIYQIILIYFRIHNFN